jgi:GNAT superfamily N-acetyltransferase
MELVVELLASSTAADGPAMGQMVELVNGIYAEAEAGLWVEGAPRTSVEEMAHLVRGGRIAVAWRDGALAGCMVVGEVSGACAKLGMLAVDPALRGAGIGGALMAFAERRCVEAGATCVEGELLAPRDWVHPFKAYLDAWYARLGYRVVGLADFAEIYSHLAPMLATPCHLRLLRKELDAGAAAPTRD